MAPKKRRRPAKPKKPAAPQTPDAVGDPVALRRRAEARVSERSGDQQLKPRIQRVFHELEVHQIELEMQNAELHRARNELEASLERYTDLYDFAPVGYFSIDESGLIREANLTGAAMLGVERSRLLKRRLLLFASPASRPSLLAWLQRVFAGSNQSDCEAVFLKDGGDDVWVGLRASAAVSPEGGRKWCRVALVDISARKKADEAQRRVDVLANANVGLSREIARRKTVEQALKKSERQQRNMLAHSHRMQRQLRHLSHRILLAQEEERKRISRELHDEIAQTMVSINVHLTALTKGAAGNAKGLEQRIARTQRLVAQSVDLVHRFARELRPPQLDDLGLVFALRSLMKEFTKQAGVHVRFKTFTSGRIRELDNANRTVFYRVAQEALANVARHAKASAVDVSLEKLPNAIRLKIQDDGKSFEAQRVMTSKRNKRLGLIGMRERVEMVGGLFGIESAPGKGTTITAQIPVGKARARATEIEP